jgi:hypothetical protein
MADKQATVMDVWEITQSMQKIVSNHVKLLLDQYKVIKGIYGGPNKILMETVREFWPQGTDKFFVLFDMWLENQMQAFEKTVDESIKEYAESVTALEFMSPNTDHYLMLVGEHTKLWIENYKKLKERREQASQETLDAMKKLLPMPVHPILDNANSWIMEQNERIENEVIDKVKKFNIKLETVRE